MNDKKKSYRTRARWCPVILYILVYNDMSAFCLKKQKCIKKKFFR